MQSPQELFVYKLAEMYDVEQKLAQALPILAKEVENPEVKQAFTEHEQETRQHVRNIEQCFQILGSQPAAAECQTVKGLQQDHDRFVQMKPSPAALTKFDIKAGCDTEALEASKYSGLIDDANTLGFTQIVPFLEENLIQEEAAQKKLMKIGHELSKSTARA